MKNSGVVGIIILFIIGYAIIAIGIASAVIGLAAGLFYLIRWIIKTIQENKLKSINKESFYESLIQQYGLIDNFTDDEKIDNKLKWAVSQILSIQSVNSQLNQGFITFKSIYRDAINKSSIWSNVNLLQGYSCDSSTLSRHNFSFQESGYLDVIGTNEHPFSLRTKNQSFYFYPNFVITEVNCEYKLIKYNDISVNNIDSIYVTEQSGKIIRGASPVFYNYLHQRVDGGPDRRYKNNPSTPVYCHTICRLCIGMECQIISATSDSVDLLKRGLIRYKKDLIANPIQAGKRIKDINLASNQYASQIREIINEHGKDILNYRVFINLLKDYKFPKEYPHIIPIYELLQQNKYMENLVKEGCEYSYLDDIKITLTQTSTYSEDEVVTALAFLGYGLQLNT